jgi:hypothetical protein
MRTAGEHVIFGTGAIGLATFAALCRREAESDTDLPAAAHPA